MIWPSGAIERRRVKADLVPCPVPPEKTFPYPADPNQIHNPRRPVPNEGRCATSGNVVRDAMDANVLVTNSTKADDEVVWF